MIRHEIDVSFAVAALAALSGRMTDMTPVMQSLGEYLVTSTRERFPTGKAPDGTPWAPKSATTLARYARRGDGQPLRPLYGPTGLLSQQFASFPTATGVEWGSNLIYSAVMQFGAAKGAFGSMANGSAIPWGNIPARPFLGLSPEDEAVILDDLAEWLEGAVEAP
ncbi:MAG: phage virion morphogenesis protein [Paracoccaceae bacterium]|nr:MAG: phage virion morphogenesis protein [Paracoccaceae bacterium]